ncbi:MAG TPA: hypothetical protein VNY08_10320 [Bradyrhizobium sp.]|jgi:hypothetical protein|nr:hypothetical protein [Bradyrhizobium sp.]
MSDKTKTKAELLEMLAEAVRNTQPPPVRNTQPEPVGDAQPEPKRKTQPRKTALASKRPAKNKSVRGSASSKQRRR